MANNNVASWTAGTILFGGKELHSVSAGSTADATPVGINGNMVDDAVGDGRYIVFWERANPSIFQTVLESAYVSDDNRIIVMELTGSATGGEVQIQSRDASHEASDKLNSDSFNKIIAGNFSTGAMTGALNPTYRAPGVTMTSDGIKMWSDLSSQTTLLPNLTLDQDDGLSFYTPDNNTYLMARFTGSSLKFYDQSAVAASDVSTMLAINSNDITFYKTSGASAADQTVKIVGNSASTTNGIYLYGYTTSFSAGDSLISFNDNTGTPAGSNTDRAMMGLLQSGSDEYLTMFGLSAGIYLKALGASGGSPTPQASIWLEPENLLGAVYIKNSSSDGYTGLQQLSGMATNQLWTFPTAIPTAGDYLEADAYDAGTGTVTLKWSDPTKHSTALASGSVPTSAYGTFRYDTDGDGGTADVLAFASGQTNATPASATAQSSFWSMLSESDGVSGSRLIFEPIVDYNTTKNRAFIGYHNPLFGIYSYYLNGGDGEATFPSHTFSNDLTTGMYLSSTGNLALAAGGYSRVHIYSGGLYPGYDNFYDLGHASYMWQDIYATNGTIQTSDVRLKELITPITLGLDFVNDLNPVSYKWKNKKEDKVDQTHYGILAQEVMETLEKYGISSVEEFGGITYEGGEEDYYGARYTEFIPMLIKAVQELSDEVKELKEKN
jgi:hypothetical protein